MESSICIPNIGSGERRKRLLLGVVALVISLGLLAALIALDAGRWWRLGLFVPFLMSMVGFFQAREKT